MQMIVRCVIFGFLSSPSKFSNPRCLSLTCRKPLPSSKALLSSTDSLRKSHWTTTRANTSFSSFTLLTCKLQLFLWVCLMFLLTFFLKQHLCLPDWDHCLLGSCRRIPQDQLWADRLLNWQPLLPPCLGEHSTQAGRSRLAQYPLAGWQVGIHFQVLRRVQGRRRSHFPRPFHHRRTAEAPSSHH